MYLLQKQLLKVIQASKLPLEAIYYTVKCVYLEIEELFLAQIKELEKTSSLEEVSSESEGEKSGGEIQQ